MKKKFNCPVCGTPKLSNLFIVPSKGKSISLQLCSQVDIREASGKVWCLTCGSSVGHICHHHKEPRIEMEEEST